MKNSINKLFIFLTLVSSIIFSNCNNSDEESLELNMQEKIALLESGEWLLKGFEQNVMHTFNSGKRFTYYANDTVFSEAIPGTEEYTINGELLTIDFNFGNFKTFELKFSCDNTIVEFFENDQLNTTLYKKESNYMQCL